MLRDGHLSAVQYGKHGASKVSTVSTVSMVGTVGMVSVVGMEGMVDMASTYVIPPQPPPLRKRKLPQFTRNSNMKHKLKKFLLMLVSGEKSDQFWKKIFSYFKVFMDHNFLFNLCKLGVISLI